jgi:Immunity protein 32
VYSEARIGERNWSQQMTQGKLLTFELDGDGEQLFIHGDVQGLRDLVASLQHLITKAEAGEPDHDHLFTEEWGGDELTSASQLTDAAVRLIHHVKIDGWPTAEGAKAYQEM